MSLSCQQGLWNVCEQSFNIFKHHNQRCMEIYKYVNMKNINQLFIRLT